MEYTNEGDPVRIVDSARVFRSMDEGLSWQNITGNLHATFIRGFDVAPVGRIILRCSACGGLR